MQIHGWKILISSKYQKANHGKKEKYQYLGNSKNPNVNKSILANFSDKNTSNHIINHYYLNVMKSEKKIAKSKTFLA